MLQKIENGSIFADPTVYDHDGMIQILAQARRLDGDTS